MVLSPYGCKDRQKLLHRYHRISFYDLIHIGDGTSIGSGSQLLGYSVASDCIEFNIIDIGRDCYVGTTAFLASTL